MCIFKLSLIFFLSLIFEIVVHTYNEMFYINLKFSYLKDIAWHMRSSHGKIWKYTFTYR